MTYLPHHQPKQPSQRRHILAFNASETTGHTFQQGKGGTTRPAGFSTLLRQQRQKEDQQKGPQQQQPSRLQALVPQELPASNPSDEVSIQTVKVQVRFLLASVTEENLLDTWQELQSVSGTRQ